MQKKFYFIIVLTIATLSLSHQKDLRDLFTVYQDLIDLQKDGYLTLQEFCTFASKIEPEDHITLDQCRITFDMLDIHQKGKIAIKNLFNNIGAFKSQDFDPETPQEIHISLTNDSSVIQVMWVTPLEKYKDPFVQWGLSEDLLNFENEGWYHTYNAGGLGFHGNIYVTYMYGLKPSTRYYYKVGDHKTKVMSSVISFVSNPTVGDKSQYYKIAMFGDFGTIIPFSGPISQMIARDHTNMPYNMSILLGDIAYAGVNSQGEFEPIWDLFGMQIQPWASTAPFMPGVGNHEHYSNYTAYLNRYMMPQSPGSRENFWFSFDYGSIHFVHMSTEHDYIVGSPQWNFLDNDLAQARNNSDIEWIFFGSHRPFYNSDKSEYDQHQPGSPLLVNLEPLFKKYKVDIVFSGHMHCYERTFPVYQSKISQYDVGNRYVNKEDPIYITQGTAGALQIEQWIHPQPEWSAIRYARYGYGKLMIHPNRTLHYQTYSWPDKLEDEFWIIKE